MQTHWDPSTLLGLEGPGHIFNKKLEVIDDNKYHAKTLIYISGPFCFERMHGRHFVTFILKHFPDVVEGAVDRRVTPKQPQHPRGRVEFEGMAESVQSFWRGQFLHLNRRSEICIRMRSRLVVRTANSVAVAISGRPRTVEGTLENAVRGLGEIVIWRCCTHCSSNSRDPHGSLTKSQKVNTLLVERPQRGKNPPCITITKSPNASQQVGKGSFAAFSILHLFSPFP